MPSGAKKTTNTIVSRHLKQIEKEYNNAVKKHPKFARFWTAKSKSLIDSTMQHFQQLNDEDEALDCQRVDNVIFEELYEVLSAIKHKNEDELKQELVQLIVVCLRALEKIEAEEFV